MCRMRGLARFVGWRGREVEERCEPGAIDSRGRAVGVGLAFGLGGERSRLLTGAWLSVLTPWMALQLFFWERYGKERVEEQPLEAIGVLDRD